MPRFRLGLTNAQSPNSQQFITAVATAFDDHNFHDSIIQYTVASSTIRNSPRNRRRTTATGNPEQRNPHTSRDQKLQLTWGRPPTTARKAREARVHLRDDDDVVGEGRPPVVRRAVPRRARARLRHTHARTHGAQRRRRSVASQIWRRMKRRRSDRSGAPRIGPANEGVRERGRGGGPHGDGGLGGARRRRRGVEVPQQDPLPVDGLLHCSPSVAAGTRARTRWEFQTAAG